MLLAAFDFDGYTSHYLDHRVYWMVMKRVWVGVFGCWVMLAAAAAQGASAQDKDKDKAKKDEKTVLVKGYGRRLPPEAELPGDSTTEGTVTVGGQTIAYKAVAGTLTVGSTDAQDATAGSASCCRNGREAAGQGQAGGGAGDGADVLRGVLQEGRGAGAAGDVPV